MLFLKGRICYFCVLFDFIDMIEKVLSKFYFKLSHFPYLSKVIILLSDLFFVAVSFFLTYQFSFYLMKTRFHWNDFLLNLSLCLIICLFFFRIFKTYAGLIRHSTFYDVFRLFLATFCANCVLYLIGTLNYYLDWWSVFPTISYVVHFAVSFVLIFFYRMSIKLFYEFAQRKVMQKKRIPILVLGTDYTLLKFAEVLNNGGTYKIVGFISNQENDVQKEVLGLPIYSIDEVLKHHLPLKLFKALLIDPKRIDRSQKQCIFDICLEYNIELLSTPDWNEWKETSKIPAELKKTRIEDLLGRIPIAINTESIAENLKDKVVLITGAAGSIGSEIVRQLSLFNTHVLILCDNAETPLHELCLELNEKFPKTSYFPKICNVQDYLQMKNIFQKYKPDYIYHAAAYKHVPMMENHPCEAVLANVLGSKNIVDLAVENEAEAFVMVSTDKAVNPTNVMGATKRIAEIYVQSLYNKIKDQQKSSLRIITTRFGNVLGSNGSVIPLFTKQIEKGGPLTVTHKDVIRYFMTIPEACRLVLEAGNMGKGGEVFLFDMGESVRIVDLAEKMIRLLGLEPYKDIDIVFTGLRPGEKLYEELFYDEEKVQLTHNEKIRIGAVTQYDFELVAREIDELIRMAYDYNKLELVRKMKKIVPEYISQNSYYSILDTKEDGSVK